MAERAQVADAEPPVTAQLFGALAVAHARHSTLRPSFWIRGPHFWRSAAMNSPKVLRSDTTGSAITEDMRSFTTASCPMVFAVSSIFWIISFDTPARTPMPNHEAVSYP